MSMGMGLLIVRVRCRVGAGRGRLGAAIFSIALSFDRDLIYEFNECGRAWWVWGALDGVSLNVLGLSGILAVLEHGVGTITTISLQNNIAF